MTWDSDRETIVGIQPPAVHKASHNTAHHAKDSLQHLNFADSELKLAEKPFEKDPSERHGRRPPRVTFIRREAAATPELFYDLWFVANLAVFSASNPITEKDTLLVFIAYFVLLWTTWFVTTVYMARFERDSILARVGFACHLASIIGFTILGIGLGKKTLLPSIIRITSLTMALSRFALSAQYGVLFYQARRYLETRNSILTSVLLHSIPGLIYLILGVTVDMDDSDGNGSVFTAWWAIALAELVVILAHSAISDSLSFEGSHITERLNLLTLIVIGEGATILTKKLTVIMDYTYIHEILSYWTPPLVGTIVCAASILYLCFMLYFDWMPQHNHMKSIPLAFWLLFHLPFHCVLILLAEGTGQWGILWRAGESLDEITAALKNSIKGADTTAAIGSALQNITSSIMDSYDVESEGDHLLVQNAIDKVKSLPNSALSDVSDNSPLVDATNTVVRTLGKAVLKSYYISSTKYASDLSAEDSNVKAIEDAATRQLLVLTYLFISAGLVLIVLMILHLIAKKKEWTLFNIFRTGFITAVGIALSLVALVNTNLDSMEKFLDKPWQLPIIVVAFLISLVLTHIPHPK